MAIALKSERIWFEKHRYDEAEKQYYIKLAKVLESSISLHLSNGKPLKRMKQEKKKEKVEKKKECKDQDRKAVDNRKQKKKDNKDEEMKQHNKDKGSAKCPPTLASEVAKCRQHIKESLECVDGIANMAGSTNVDLLNRINTLEKEKTGLNKIVCDLKNLVLTLEKRVTVLEGGKPTVPNAKAVNNAAPKKETPRKNDDDDGVDLFASDSDEESEEAARIREERLAAYNAKKSKKPELIAKSNIILSVSPWDDETDMTKLEKCVRSVEMDGLLWGASKMVPLAYGIHKLHISCVVEDAKVSVDLLQEKIQEFEDYVQSVDIAAFNKV